MSYSGQPVLILGAGINGAAIARELAINGIPVWIVDVRDIASGTTAYSSRLIHGGLRYLEHGDFRLVAESLSERARLLRLAPHLVRPLRLYIPVERRGGGWIDAFGNFIGLTRRANPSKRRGLRLVRTGLRLYDWLARDRSLPGWSEHSISEPTVPPVNPQLFPWLCSYFDAQIAYPERLVVAMLRDAQQAADQSHSEFRVLTYHVAELDGAVARIRPVDESAADAPHVAATLTPAAIVNATGAWVDRTLQRLQVSSARLIGGTKGSHLVTFHPGLADALRGAGVYTEAEDGRPVFLLPFGPGALIGTTDILFDGDPAQVHSESAEIAYLLEAARRVFPHITLTNEDVDLHYCGVRPLPFVGLKSPASITRRSRLVVHDRDSPPIISIVGGKLTTCRALAEDTVRLLAPLLQFDATKNTRERPYVGRSASSKASDSRERSIQKIALEIGLPEVSISATWDLCGYETLELLSPSDSRLDRTCIEGTNLPCVLVRKLIHREWVRRLSDLVERRLMVLFHPSLNRTMLVELATILSEEGVQAASDIQQVVDDYAAELKSRYGKIVK